MWKMSLLLLLSLQGHLAEAKCVYHTYALAIVEVASDSAVGEQVDAEVARMRGATLVELGNGRYLFCRADSNPRDCVPLDRVADGP